ncbi:uncharacterized protein MONOS_15831 [Monocercomonoides exilis]|uniref:uncharacterized protein n=1 Tax=Monocercomonoides exilis TaxID=2049356 RepID=UPI003559EB94|nr:hypothetical protein MONOS_15831 [Monocercomonoides exilis]|eukprot:MONOS_15831.1-p1 / transcript=MONOS_15831.1 / gene=MONOS_15831 / organism=Monocercomonoides_exilis_PA203 / gene_product=unspecified product / transcript_product=unspecified product / location=Mono_scaffold01371:2948-3376(-) / protein_length=85 / sequence_SO=supercontig / SO=protein_coding / is_pseudo=false
MESLLRLYNPQISQAMLLWTFRDAYRLSVCCPPSVCVKMDESTGGAEVVKGDCTEGYLKERRAEGAVPNGAAAGGTAEAAAEEE